MKPSHLLYLDAGTLSVWRRQGGQLHCMARFADSAEGHAGFGQLLRKQAKSRWALLVNPDEEIYVDDWLPKLAANEQKQVLQQRLAQHFPDSAWRCARLMPALEPERQHWQMIAIRHATGLSRWLADLQTMDACLLALHAVPLQIEACCRHFGATNGATTILSTHENGARSTGLRDGWLSASHINDSHSPLAATSDTPAPLTLTSLVGHAEQGTDNDDSAMLLLSLPWRHWPQAQFAPGHLLARARMIRIAEALHVTAALMAVVSLTIIAIYGENLLNLQRQLAHLENRIDSARQTLSTERETLQRAGGAMGDARRRAEVRQAIQACQPLFSARLYAIGDTLDHHAAIRLDALRWEMPDFPASTANPITEQIELEGTLTEGSDERAALKDLKERGDFQILSSTMALNAEPRRFRWRIAPKLAP